jgi:hypothetical protein
MSTKQKTNKVTEQASNQALIDGLTKHAATLTSFSIGGTTVKATDVIAALQANNAAMSAISPAKAAWQVAVQAARNQIAKNAAMVSGVKQALKVMFAGQIDVLADFGEKPRKTPAPRTPQQKAASAAKAKATRAARNTMGSVQKKAVKGNVTGVTVTPVTAPPAAVATGSPPTTGSPGAAGSTATTASPPVAGSPAPHAS